MAPRLAALLAVLLAASCAAPGPGEFAAVTSREAEVSWRQAGDVRVSTARVTFQAAPGAALRLVVAGKSPVLTLTRVAGEWTATGPLAGRTWRGPENTAPVAVAGWLSLAEAYEGAASAPEGDTDVRTGRFSARYDRRGGVLRGFELVTVATGDRFRVTFAPGAR